jgi:tetratricopeptide (TPR) repeat protein
MGEFKELRKELDDAITYGCFESAEELAQEGLRQAAEKGYLGEAEYFKGQLEILNGNYCGAIEHFDLAIEYNPYDGAAFNDRALCMVELGIIEEAFYYFDKGIEVEPDYATIHHNKGWLLNKIGRHSEAIECFRRALELEPDRAVTYENLANALANLGDYQKALACYKKAIDLLKPEYSDIKEQIIAEMRLLEAEMNRGQP